MLKLPILAVKSSQKHSSTQDSDEETLLVSALDCLPEEWFSKCSLSTDCRTPRVHVSSVVYQSNGMLFACVPVVFYHKLDNSLY